MSSITPTIPITGVGKILFPLVSLYKETFPETTGVFSSSHAYLIPLIEPTI